MGSAGSAILLADGAVVVAMAALVLTGLGFFAVATALTLLDATIVRMGLMPATMALLGRANWWLPRWLDRRLPHVSVEGADDPRQPEPVLAGASGRG